MTKQLFAALLISSFLITPAFAEDLPPAEPESFVETTEETKIIEVPLPEIKEVVVVPEVKVPEESVDTKEVVVDPILVDPLVIAPVTFSAALAPEGELLPADTVSLLIRYGEEVAWSGTVELMRDEDVPLSPTGGTDIVSVDSDSLLATLVALDTREDAFRITDLDYYSSYDSFIVNCIEADTFENACGQWQYVINGEYPFTGIDKYVLEDGDSIYLYFGSPRRVTLSDSEVLANEEFTATAESYDPQTNNYSPLSGYTIGVTQPNPATPWSPTELLKKGVDENGQAIFSLSATGTYDIGLQEDFYYPSTSLNVVEQGEEDSGGTAGESPTNDTFDTEAAFAFLTGLQNTDGSFDSELATDWGAFAFMSGGAPSAAKAALKEFLKTDSPRLSVVADYERHAMALMAFNINPYTGGPEDYISPIVAEFDGEQIGDSGLVNDDVFALFPLLNAGYDKDDEIIKKTVEFILSEQQSGGAWESSVDMTAAAIQALSLVRSLPGVPEALTEAEGYLRGKQQGDAGFENAFSTSWVLMAIDALGDSPSDWSVGGETPKTFLASLQEEDGGLITSPDDSDTRAWALAYVIPAMKGETWSSMLHDFKKQTVSTDSDSKESKEVADEELVEEIVEEVAIEPLPAPFFALALDTVPAEEVARVERIIENALPETMPTTTEAVAVVAEAVHTELAASAADSGIVEILANTFGSFLNAIAAFLAQFFSY